MASGTTIQPACEKPSIERPAKRNLTERLVAFPPHNALINIMQFRVEHIGLASGNPVALKDWYVNKLGATVVLAIDQSPPAFFIELGGGAIFEIYSADSSSPETTDNKLAGWRHIALQVESLDSARETLTARGVEFHAESRPAGGGGRVHFFSDPEGNLLHLIERPADSIFIRS